MEILTDNQGDAWRITGNPTQVQVERRPALTQADVDKGLTLEDKPFRAVSYHNRLDHAMAWMLDQILRMELDETEAEDFVGLVGAWKRKIENVANYWRESITSTTYGRSFTEA